MPLDAVHFQNFRCFESLELSLKPRINVFVGDNASGKTSLIHGLGLTINSFFAGFSDENTRFQGFDEDDFRTVATPTGLADSKPITINFDWLGVAAALNKDTIKGRTHTKPLAPLSQLAKRWSAQLFQGETQATPLPMIASFSTKDIHTARKLTKKAFAQYKLKPSFGYYECLQGDGLLPYWTHRLLVLQEGQKGSYEIEGVKRALLDTLGEGGANMLHDVHIRHNQGEVYFILKDGREIPTEQLSDGLARVVNIVMDLAFRCVLLNQGVYQVEACQQTEGTVLIDEIDLHLHPSLQALIIKSLHRAFPKVQLIITTHAPLIMSSVPSTSEDGIFKLAYDPHQGYTCQEVTSYGMDVSSIVEAVLKVSPREPSVEKDLEALFTLIDDDNYAEAQQKLDALKAQFGNSLPDLAKATTMLDFLQVEDD